MKVTKKIFICILTFILSFNLLCNDFIFVSASSAESTFVYPDNWDFMTETEKLSYFYQYAMEHDVAYEDVPAMYPHMDSINYKFINYLICELGMVVEGTVLSKFIPALWNKMKELGTPLLDSEGYVTDDIMQELKSFLDQYLKTNLGLVRIALRSPTEIDPEYYKTNFPDSYNAYDVAVEGVSMGEIVQSSSIPPRPGSAVAYASAFFVMHEYDYAYIVASNLGGSSPEIRFYNKVGGQITSFEDYSFIIDTSTGNCHIDDYTNKIASGRFLLNYCYGGTIIAFSSGSFGFDYIRGYSSVYAGTPVYGGGGLYVPPSALRYDYSGLYDTVKDAIDNSESPTTDDIRQIVDGAIGDALDEIGNSGSDTGDEEEDEPEPDSILGYLKSINDKLKKILAQVKQIKWLSVADLVDDIIFNLIDLKQDFEPVVQTMSRKFPFSIPWDTVLVFSLLADSPETPVYEIPFVIESAGINEVLVVDLGRFEKLSKVSRFMLTLTFLLMLFALTRKIAGWFAN